MTFKFPVEIGDLLRMRTLVLHTWTQPGDPNQGRAHVQVEASVTQPEKRQRWAQGVSPSSAILLQPPVAEKRPTHWHTHTQPSCRDSVHVGRPTGRRTTAR